MTCKWERNDKQQNMTTTIKNLDLMSCLNVKYFLPFTSKKIDFLNASIWRLYWCHAIKLRQQNSSDVEVGRSQQGRSANRAVFVAQFDSETRNFSLICTMFIFSILICRKILAAIQSAPNDGSMILRGTFSLYDWTRGSRVQIQSTAFIALILTAWNRH